MFTKGNKLAGNRKGCPNKVNKDILTAVDKAFNELGGYKWLVKLGNENPQAFATLLGRCLPRDIKLSGTEGDGTINITIRGYNGNQSAGTSA